MTDNIIKQPPLPDTINFNHTMENAKTEVMRITREGVWVNPDMQVDETAKAVLDALSSQVKVLVQRAVEEEREKVVKWMMEHGYATGHGDTIEDLLEELEWQVAPVHAVNMSQECVDETAKGEHEPVAWRTFDGEGGYDYRSYEMNEYYDKEWTERNPNHTHWVEPLYTAPPKREWVGLTDADIAKIRRNGAHSVSDKDFMVIEAKLREKNA